MTIGILGTGMVGRAHAAQLAKLGHTVHIGTQDPEKTLAVAEPDHMGNPPFAEWHKENSSVSLVPFAEAAAADVVLNALKGEVVVEVLATLTDELSGKVLIDISNPLDFSNGMPPSLFLSNTNSLGEEVQKTLPDTKVVKAFNTMNAYLQVDPKQLADSDHHLFICGNDAEAKAQVTKLAEGYGWTNIVDMGDITNARGTEMLLPIWVRLWGTLGTPMFNFKIVQ